MDSSQPSSPSHGSSPLPATWERLPAAHLEVARQGPSRSSKLRSRRSARCLRAAPAGAKGSFVPVPRATSSRAPSLHRSAPARHSPKSAVAGALVESVGPSEASLRGTWEVGAPRVEPVLAHDVLSPHREGARSSLLVQGSTVAPLGPEGRKGIEQGTKQHSMPCTLEVGLPDCVKLRLSKLGSTQSLH